jgi:hypothetical protein
LESTVVGLTTTAAFLFKLAKNGELFRSQEEFDIEKSFFAKENERYFRFKQVVLKRRFS